MSRILAKIPAKGLPLRVAAEAVEGFVYPVAPGTPNSLTITIRGPLSQELARHGVRDGVGTRITVLRREHVPAHALPSISEAPTVELGERVLARANDATLAEIEAARPASSRYVAESVDGVTMVIDTERLTATEKLELANKQAADRLARKGGR